MTHFRYASATWFGHAVLRGVRGDPDASRINGHELPEKPNTCIISWTTTVTKVSYVESTDVGTRCDHRATTATVATTVTLKVTRPHVLATWLSHGVRMILPGRAKLPMVQGHC